MTFLGVFSELQAHSTSTDKWMGPLCTNTRSLPKMDGSTGQATSLELWWSKRANAHLAEDISHQRQAMTSQELADSSATSLRTVEPTPTTAPVEGTKGPYFARGHDKHHFSYSEPHAAHLGPSLSHSHMAAETHFILAGLLCSWRAQLGNTHTQWRTPLPIVPRPALPHQGTALRHRHQVKAPLLHQEELLGFLS